MWGLLVGSDVVATTQSELQDYPSATVYVNHTLIHNFWKILTSSKIMHEEMELVERNKKQKTDRILIIKLNISNVVHMFVNCYAPNTTTDKVNFLHQLQDKIQEIETDSLWVGGDFNVAFRADRQYRRPPPS